MKRRASIWVVLLAVLGAACSGARRPPGHGHGDEVSPVPKARCDAPAVPVPEGFLLVRSTERPRLGTPGIHRTYRDGSGRRLDVLLGIEGEVGEGLPLVSRVPLAGGLRARLLGRGSTWILTWDELPPCGPTAVIGNGMGRAAFSALVRGTGLLRAPD